MVKTNQLLEINRLEKHKNIYPEIKDPSVALVNGKWYMYASVGRSRDQQWIVGRFEADNATGTWNEIEQVDFKGIQGPQLCAPAVLYDSRNEEGGKWKMYIQTACFEENGVIAEASSYDGRIFSSMHASLITSQHSGLNTKHKVVGVYDAGISEVTVDGEELLAMIFSGYRKVGSGDIYLTWKRKNDNVADWAPAKLILDQEDVPFHNNPNYEHFEWGLEGGKILQVHNSLFLLVGVCFLPMPKGYEGKRQRVFFAAANALTGPYIPMGTPFPPQTYEHGMGEHGHPDAFINNEEMVVIFQERKKDGDPWHLRYATFDLKEFIKYAEQAIVWSPQRDIISIKEMVLSQ